ncbi:hypothetical protein [Xanthomonas citri]|uniref:hypothetical protein n=1 Tax=Xanthomonas citri TaxID=346 RepID=UPI000C08CE9A|nr:hypothetical protein [Xanthomonas citri]MCT8358171.1 hypothetical protein [Xanthomonas citri pv. anacardii]MCT8362229.1 hypothetical protein [Xanthomonas citri pv. anacardii]MCT8366280.1 hypothetical protein [Xanthomonas citri pv. anacardii]MCT8370304.1 hypothetical protein [Xanthomonas citri pv. anacardii]MCT8374268.1 hypothetical protein [Xanthomonas citri pv. anacardii]
MALIARSAPVARRQRVLRWADRWFGFHSPRQIASAMVAVLLLGALLSLGLGQDANWDLRNYHLYIGDAWATDRLGTDLAPAQMQSYFSPLLDAMHAWLMLQLPGPVAGALLGGLHALVFIPLAALAWRVLSNESRRAQWVPLFALAGMCSAVFLSELGNTMGDTASAIPVLAALAVVLLAQFRARNGLHVVHLWAVAGALIGLAVALKLTNALYALALVPAVLCDGGHLRSRVLALSVLAGVALLVLLLVAGPWYWQVWQHLGNPLFPQFNGVFKSPLAQPVSIADVRWLPRTIGEQLIWPLLFTLKPQRIGDLGLVQAGWAVLYGVVAIAAGRALVRRPVRAAAVDRAAIVLLVFFGVAYALWQAIFSIHRYLVVLELLAPLVLWIVCRHAFAARANRKAAWLIGACALVAVVGWKDWGHESWARDSFQVEQPVLGDPAASSVLLVGDEPQSWRVPLLPSQARYIGVATNISETDHYRQRVRALIAERPQLYAMLGAARDKQQLRIDRMNRLAQQFGWERQPGCTRLRWLVARGLRAELDTSQPDRCVLAIPKGKALDIAAADQAVREAAQQRLAAYGLTLDPARCRTLSSHVGQAVYPYQFCQLALPN